MEQDPSDDFASESFFDQSSLQQQIQQIDATANLNAAVADVPLLPHPAVVQQLARRWYSGCLERIAWSRHGHLASLSEDGSTVYLECLQYKHDTKSWSLHERHALTTVFEDAISLAFSATGGELAVVDLKGRVWIYHSAPPAANRLNLARQGAIDEGDELSQPVGMKWLSQERQDRPRNIVTHASKTESRWQHTNARARPPGPFWHRAVVVVHRNGLLTLCFQRRDGQYSRITKQLAPQDGVLYTHAAFASTLETKMLIALHSVKKSISVYFLAIDWSEVGQNVEGLPVLTVDSVSAQLYSRPTGSPTIPDSYDPDSWLLSHLEVMQSSDVEKAVQVPPMILAVSTGVNRSVNIPEAGYLVSSTIKRWAVRSVETQLHPLFDALPSTGTAIATPRLRYTFQEQPDKEEQVITSIHHVEGASTLVVTIHDSRTDFLSPEDLSPVSYAATGHETTCMSQSGFAFPNTQLILKPGFSTNVCARADIGTDGKTQLVALEYQLGRPQSLQPLDPQIDAAIASLNLTFARACWSNGSIDDILTSASQSVPPQLIPIVISSMYRTLFRDSEFVNEKTPNSELERVFHKPLMAKVLSYHASLAATCPGLPTIASTEGRNGWTLSAQWAWLVNNIRQTTTFMFMNLRDVQNPPVVVSQDFTDMLCSNLRWGLSLIRFIFNTILEMGDRETNPEMFDDRERGRLGDTQGNGEQGLVTLLLNCHTSRIFLIAFVIAVRTYAKITEPKNQHQLQVLKCIQGQTNNKGLSFQAIEALLKFEWSAAGDVEGDMAATAVRQLDMMATGIVHEAYQGTMKNLLNKLLNSPSGLRAKGMIDRLKLFTDHVDLEYIFLNHDILGRTSKIPNKQEIIYDVHRKRPITKGMAEPQGSGQLMVRKCLRCGSFSEDLVVPPKEWPRQLAMLLARCVCDGNWVFEAWDSVRK